MDKKNIYNNSYIRFTEVALMVLFTISIFSGCSATKSARLLSLERNRLESEARGEEQKLIEYNDPQAKKKHTRRKKRYRRSERRRLKALKEQRELKEDLDAEQWWIDKELATLLDADEQRKRHNEEVRLWKKEQAELDNIINEVNEIVKNTPGPKVKEAPKSFEQRVLSSLGMVYVQGGCFEAGDNTSSTGAVDKVSSEKCVDDFYVGKHEITTGEFLEFVKETNYVTDAERDGGCYLYTGNTWYKTKKWKKKNEYQWRNTSFSQDADHPVACVSWNDANEFVEWKSLKHGIQYRLPTEAEWEYAASDGYHSEKWSGTSEEEEIGIYAWHSNNSNNSTHPVGQRKPNKLGLFDMSGNVWEWVQDNYDNSDNSLRVIRGGSWYSMHSNLTAAKRFKHLKSNYRDFASGFRLGMDGRIKLNKVSLAK